MTKVEHNKGKKKNNDRLEHSSLGELQSIFALFTKDQQTTLFGTCFRIRKVGGSAL
jgi:hypothetical protein